VRLWRGSRPYSTLQLTLPQLLHHLAKAATRRAALGTCAPRPARPAPDLPSPPNLGRVLRPAHAKRQVPRPSHGLCTVAAMPMVSPARSPGALIACKRPQLPGDQTEIKAARAGHSSQATRRRARPTTDSCEASSPAIFGVLPDSSAQKIEEEHWAWSINCKY